MGEGSLSQDEIDALLQGADETAYDAGPIGGLGGGDELSPIDKDLLADILSHSFSPAGRNLETLLSKSVKFTSPSVESKPSGDITNELGAGAVNLFTNLSGGVTGMACLVISADNASKIVNVLLGGLSTGALETAQLQTLKDAFVPIMGTVSLQMGLKLNSTINGSPLEVSLSRSAKDLILPEAKQIVKTTLNLNIEGIGVFKVNYLISMATAEEILNLSKKGSQKPQQSGGGGMNVSVNQPNMGGYAQQGAGQVGIKGIAFPSLSSANQSGGNANLNLLMDVQMSVTVELGRTKMYIKDILGLGEGSIIELDKLAGEPVDLLVNGKLIAKGEVVVIDENFGVRVTDIVSPTDRIKTESK
jgi:flagellar motor switch protein FliN/FliY